MYRAPVHARVALAQILAVEPRERERALLLVEVAARLRARGEAEEDDDGEDEARDALDEEEDAPLHDGGVFEARDAVADQAAESVGVYRVQG